jgi:hypothetical protein
MDTGVLSQFLEITASKSRLQEELPNNVTGIISSE